VRVFYIDDLYSRSASMEEAYLQKKGLTPGGHAGLADTASLMFVDRQGRWVRRRQIAGAAHADGVEGDPTRASAQLGRELVQFKIESALAQIRRLLEPRR
jgi:creatinine amidohydrolase/Fe(II)-dependent formamide hydrolase-like protein